MSPEIINILQVAVSEGVISPSDLPAGVDTEVTLPISNSFYTQSAVFMNEAVKIVSNNGMEKYISYEDFLKAIGSSIGDVDSGSSGTPFNLPSNVFFFSVSTSEIRINTYYTSRISTLKFINPRDYKTKTFDILMPNLVLAIVLKAGTTKNSWKVTSSKYFCTDLPVNKLPKTFINQTNSTDRVYLLPMSNTYREGNMCFGGNSMPINMADNNLRSLDWYYQYLWESPFNCDLGIAALSRSMEVPAWYDLLKKRVENSEPFPYNLLSGWTAL
jgi:hypothetical protein